MQDLTQFDVGRIPGQDVAAAGPSDALDQLVDLERDDDLFQVPDRNLFFVGDVFQDGCLLAAVVMQGEIKHESGPVTAFGR